MTRDEVAGVLHQFEAAVPHHDPSELAAFHTADGVLQSLATGTVNGRPAIEQTYGSWLRAFPDLSLELLELLIDGNRAAAVMRFSGRQEGRFFGAEATGKRIEFPLGALYRLDGSLIAHARYFYDFSTLLLETGALKVK